jgi:sugar/nucleoside kinase (ribokinase family)
MIKRLKIIVIGHITLDEYNAKLIPGGSAYYCSQTYLALGAQVKLISIVGNDFHFDEVFQGMDTLVKRTGKTTQFKNIYKKNSIREQISLAQAEPISYDGIPEDFKECDVLHLVPVLGEVDINMWVTLIKSKLVAIGLQGWLRRINSSKIVLSKKCTFSEEEYKKIDLLCMSEDDIKDQSDLLENIIKFVPIVALTHGVKGCDIYRDGIKKSYGVFKTIEVDPTGAGDVFASGLVHSIASGKSEMEAGHIGAGLASVIIEDVGGNAFNRILEGVSRAKYIDSKDLEDENLATQPGINYYENELLA